MPAQCLTRLRLTPQDYLVALGFTLCLLAVTWQRVVPEVVGIYNDDGVYVVTAKALATGQGYRLLHLPGEPLQTKYPPLFPAILAVVWWLFPEFPANVLVMKAVCVAFSSAAGGLAWLFLVRFGYASRTAAALGLAAGFCAPAFLYLLALPLSESLFLLLLIACLWIAERVSEGTRPASWRLALTGGALLAAMVLTRSIGLFVGAGVVLGLLYRRQLRAPYLLSALIPVAAWYAWVALTASAHGSLQDAYNVSYAAWWRRLAFDAPARVIAQNTGSLVFDVASVGSQGVVELLPHVSQVFPCFLVLSLLAWWGAVYSVHTRLSRPLVLGLLGYLVAVVCWPWPPFRFLLVVLPILFSLAIESALRVPGTRAATRTVAALTVCVVAGVTAAELRSSLRIGRTTRATGFPVLVELERPAYWRDFKQAFATVRQLTPPDAVVATVVDPMIYLYAGRKAVFPYEMNSIQLYYGGERWVTPARLAVYWRERGVTHALRLPIPAWEYPALEDSLGRWRSARPEELTSLWVSADPRFELLGIHPARAPSAAITGQGDVAIVR